ncbi:MAG: T9SS type A sorting domain-containing protein [Candidatus Cloacimonetes bacterium]|nr:T9SS type A sorting domain-containing protein [Candidatus Cloacimonadota bacterium]
MKKNLLFTTMLLISGFLFAETIIFKYNFEIPVIKTENGYSEIIYENCMNFGDEGNPLLPYFGADVLLPQGQEIENVRILSEEYYSIMNDITIKPASRQFPISQKIENYEIVPNEKIYNSFEPFPINIIDHVNTQYLAGHSIGSFSICPVSYIPGNQQIKFLKDIQIEITTEITDYSISLERFLKDSRFVHKRITSIVDNPDMLTTYNYPSNRNDEYDILLITNAALLPYFQDYIDYKVSAGFIVEPLTTEDIYSTYSGIDEQEKIRNCVIDYYINFGISFVILGGDSAPNDPSQNVIPHRGFFAIDDDNIPSDMYYACLDRGSAPGSGPDWNNDGDNRWGEPGEYDLFAEVGIGRICVDDETEIQNFTSKLFLYQNNPVIEDVEKALMIGEELNNNPWTFGGDYKDEIVYGTSAHGFTTVGISDNFAISTLYDRDITWNKYDVFAQFNNTGINLLNHLGHSSPTYNMKMYNSDITTYNFTNDGITRGFVIGYSQGCYNGSFDNWHWSSGYGEDCFAEKITTLETGEVACVANSRFGWYMPGNTNSSSQYLDRQFYDAIFGEDITIIGFTNSDSKEDNMSYFTGDGYMRWSAYETNLFGDPSLDIWTAIPTEITVTCPPGVQIGASQITIQTDTPFARIGLMQNDELIGRGVADASGNAVIDFFEIITNTSEISVSIIGHNKIRYQGTVIVIADQPYVIYNSHEINDNTGNGNGVADFGENIILDMTLENIGNLPANDVVATLSAEDEYITISDSTQNYGTINAITTSVQLDAFEFDIAGNIPDQHEIDFELEITSSSDTWLSQFNIVVNAPLLIYEDLIIDDSAGNNNGILDPGETVFITIPTVNAGHIISPEANATLTCTNQLISIENNSFELGQIDVGATANAVFEVSADEEITIGTPITLNYDITAGEYIFEYEIIISVGLILEDFETGDFSSFLWEFGGNADWEISTNAWEGSYCGKSGTIGHNQTSSLILNFDVLCNSEISFYRKTSCEDVGSVTGNYYDYLVFYIDGIEMDKWAGETPWGLVTFDVTAGNHTFKWMYHKDVGVVGGQDCVWVDYIVFPPGENPIPPDFVIDPQVIEKEMETNTIDIEILSISNEGGGIINYTIEIFEPVEWMSITVSGGSLAANELHEIEITFDTTDLIPDDYSSAIIITTDTREQYIVPVFLTVIGTNANGLIPMVTELNGNYPNPFNPSGAGRSPETLIKYSLKEESQVKLEIFNIKGQKVRTLIDSEQDADYHRVLWNGKDNSEKSVSSGIYFYRFKAGKYTKTEKMLLLK